MSGNFWGILPAIVIGAAALIILIRRSVAFVRTRGESTCKNCPYGNCSSCCSKSSKKKAK